MTTCPTTGQEVDLVSLWDVTAAPEDEPLLSSSGTATTGMTRKKELDVASRGGGPAKASSTGSDQRREVTLREVGGRMMCVWGKFLANFAQSLEAVAAQPAAALPQPKNADHSAELAGTSCCSAAVVFVVDVSLPAGGTQLASACIEFHNLILPRAWPILVLLNKSCAPCVMPAALVRDLLLPPTMKDASSRVTFLEADTWTGLGLGDIVEWLRHCE
jgi:hypothetical protein